MTNATIYFPAGVDAEAKMAAFGEVAAELGMTTERGSNAGKGNRRELIQSIIGGEIALILLSEDYRLDGDELSDLHRMRDEAHPYTAELLDAVILAIKAAIRRRDWFAYGEKEQE